MMLLAQETCTLGTLLPAPRHQPRTQSQGEGPDIRLKEWGTWSRYPVKWAKNNWMFLKAEGSNYSQRSVTATTLSPPPQKETASVFYRSLFPKQSAASRNRKEGTWAGGTPERGFYST